MATQGVTSNTVSSYYMSSARAQMAKIVSRVRKSKSTSTSLANRAQARSASYKRKAAEMASAARQRAIKIDPKMMRRRGMAKVKAYPPAPLPILRHIVNLWA